ncbi:NAD-dependent epimerase/dehydratase family protein [Gymnodinialimonas ceratoperidinii]|uniref:NAD-dependent epimerase/dehydratase family protein n=1 Tax=Gymnodinialimonas ceratoperidinii TaxID=2856823 RepID=A0A8F6TWD0_9RHOB|nr:NAD-dependent epimerase/dehydratase family protein [Gymnodinialimonas ceratoperidinii]QXT39394.1 NAD-dependent epimerase/dehydratase family protein [Gymnodinialimonas ceratoperidinii]
MSKPSAARPQRILLVGGSGRVGKLVLPRWRRIVTTADSLVAQHRDPQRETGLYWPLLTTAPKDLAAHEFDVIVSLAGVTPASAADLSLNTPLAVAVLQAALSANIPRVLLASSSAVYGAGDGTPFTEGSALSPTTPYGSAKREMEEACAPWRARGLEVCCLRIGNVAGADALLSNAARTAPNTPLTIDCFADGGGPIRSYIGVETLADVLHRLATQAAPLPESLNIAAPREVAMTDLARAAGRAVAFRPASPGAQQRITLDCRALAERHLFDPASCEPFEMVAQWQRALSP